MNLERREEEWLREYVTLVEKREMSVGAKLVSRAISSARNVSTAV
jgi:hypothetical protein